jgi:hypothetical protein
MGIRGSQTLRVTCVHARSAVAALIAALALFAGCSSGSTTSPNCNSCDGNVAVSCSYNCHQEEYTNPQRTDCGAQKCVVESVPQECTDMGTTWMQQVNVASCK